MKIDRNKALKILEAEAADTAPGSTEWVKLVTELSEECDRGANKTFIPMLGTALLARSTDVRADPFALKTGPGTPGAYSARTLCQHVLAAHAPRLEIDLGVTGREPLNNQPFFAEERVHENMPVHRRARAGFRLLLECLNLVSLIRTEAEARNALRAFLSGRKPKQYESNLDSTHVVEHKLQALEDILEQFVRANSEYGRRAQAVVAGILDSTSTYEVTVSHVHDPDRHFPGDVNLFRESETVIAFEVRDKAVNSPDAYHFVKKTLAANVRSAGIVAVSANQEVLEDAGLISFAEYNGINLQIFYSWIEFIEAASFWGEKKFAWRQAVERIHERSLELGVSAEGLRHWENLVHNK